MKKLMNKALLALIATLCVVGAANANWQCKMHNARGQVWYGTAATRSQASAYAMKYCVRGSERAANCVMDYCHSGNFGTTTSGTWQCNATNARGQHWVGTGGSRSVAAANAVGFCTAHSAHASNCVINSCFIKY